MDTNNYRVRIVHGSEEFEAEGDKQFVLDMIKRYAPTTERDSSPAKAQGKKRQAPSSGKGLSVGEFVRQLGFKKHTDQVLGFAYYLERHADTPEFTAADINNLYYDAKLDASNTSQMIIQNIRRGYMMEGKAKGSKAKRSYTITRSGEDYIEAKLASNPEESA